MCCKCERTPDEDRDMDEIAAEWYERERELIDRAEEQKPLDWYKVAQAVCLPSLAFTAAMEGRS